MKQVFIFLVALVVFSSQLNSWKKLDPDKNEFGSWSKDRKKEILMSKDFKMQASSHRLKSSQDYPIKSDIPDSLDWRENSYGCLDETIKNQRWCGSCWVFSTVSATADRFCLSTKGEFKENLSTQNLLSCIDNGQSDGCNGGYPIDAYEYMASDGVVKNLCQPYFAFHGINFLVLPCMHFCLPFFWMKFHEYTVTDPTAILDKNIERIKSALMEGPITAGMVIYDDFYDYDKGIYVPTTDEILGYHAIKMVGWGHDEEQDMDYWIIANSWGKKWGEAGYFRIKMGECEIEEDISFATANLESVSSS